MQRDEARAGAFVSNRRAPPPARCRARKLVQVGRGVVVEAQRARQRVEHLLGRVLVAALLQPHVVVGRHARQQRQLVAPQARHAPVPEIRKADVLGADELPPRVQEAADAVVAFHREHVRRRVRARVAPSLPGSPLPVVRRHWLARRPAVTVSV